jgi:hypothetical protein
MMHRQEIRQQLQSSTSWKDSYSDYCCRLDWRASWYPDYLRSEGVEVDLATFFVTRPATTLLVLLSGVARDPGM